MIFNIQKCSIHDGQGLRTLVFFKGCPLRCKWCANPESQLYETEIMESPGKCIGCGACLKVCPKGAIQQGEEGPVIDRSRCIRCLACVQRCYAGAKYAVGKEYTAEELLKEIEKDKIFYSIKGGGVTFSGGEPLTHPEELTAIAKRCKERDIHVMLESCSFGDYEKFEKALPYIDEMFFDIKHMDPGVHEELTGCDNRLILENLKKITGFGIPVTVRTPVIPGLNDSRENIEQIAEFLKDLPRINAYELLPYHQFGVNKYRALGRNYELGHVSPPEDEEIRTLVRCANRVFAETEKICFYTKDNKKEIIK